MNTASVTFDIILYYVLCTDNRPCAGSPPRGGDVEVHVFDINQPSSPTPFFMMFMALSTVFHSVNSPDNSPLSDTRRFISALIQTLKVG